MEKPIEQLSLETVRQKLATHSRRDAELTGQLAALCSEGRAGLVPPAVGERLNATRARAKALLNGAGHLVPDPVIGINEDELFAERDAVRLAIDVLQRMETELLRAADAEWVRAHDGEYRAAVKGLVLALAAASRLRERAAAILKRAAFTDVDLPLARYVDAIWIEISDINLDVFLKAAVAADVVTETELKNNAKQR